MRYIIDIFYAFHLLILKIPVMKIRKLKYNIYIHELYANDSSFICYFVRNTLFAHLLTASSVTGKKKIPKNMQHCLMWL